MAAALNCVLIVGSKRAGAIELAYARALERIGVGLVDHFDIEQPWAMLRHYRIINRLTQLLQYEAAGRGLFDYLQKVKVQYDAVIIFKGMLLSPAWISQCRSISPTVTWININPDDPFNFSSRGSTNLNVVQSIRYYDIYATWGKHLIPTIKQHGCSTVLFLPFAYDADNHFPTNASVRYKEEAITFVGAWDRHREQVLSEIADLPLKIYGGYWDRVNYRAALHGKIHPRNIYGEELRRVISSSKASINILRPQNYGSHNMRSFEIPAMRGLMVTNYSVEQDQFFPHGRASLMYSDTRDLRHKLILVLEGRCDIEQMKETALVLSRGHSYDDRAYVLCDCINHYRQSRAVA
jgi:spore maturation protein CgeB